MISNRKPFLQQDSINRKPAFWCALDFNESTLPPAMGPWTRERDAGRWFSTWRIWEGFLAQSLPAKPVSYAGIGREIIYAPPSRLSTPAAQPTMDPVLKKRPAASSSRRRVTAVRGGCARIAVLGSKNQDPDVYPAVGPCSSALLQRNLGLCRGVQYTRCTSSAVA